MLLLDMEIRISNKSEAPEQQNSVKRIEREIDGMKDRMAVIQGEITRLQGLLDNLCKTFEA